MFLCAQRLLCVAIFTLFLCVAMCVQNCSCVFLCAQLLLCVAMCCYVLLHHCSHALLWSCSCVRSCSSVRNGYSLPHSFLHHPCFNPHPPPPHAALDPTSLNTPLAPALVTRAPSPSTPFSLSLSLCGARQLKAAYIVAAKKWHPDGKDDKDKELFEKVIFFLIFL
jgi:hypothetical protein